MAGKSSAALFFPAEAQVPYIVVLFLPRVFEAYSALSA